MDYYYIHFEHVYLYGLVMRLCNSAVTLRLLEPYLNGAVGLGRKASKLLL